MSKDKISKKELESDQFMSFIDKVIHYYRENKLVVQWSAIGIIAVAVVSAGISRYMQSQQRKTLIAFENAKTEVGLSEFIVNHKGSEYVPMALFKKGNLLFNKGDFTGALETYNRFLDSYKKHNLAPYVMLSVGYCQMALEKYDTAQQTFEKMINKYPKSPLTTDAKVNLARCLLKSGSYQEAKKVVDGFIESEPNSYLVDEAKKLIPEIKRNL